MIISKEIWKDINSYEGFYQISNLGNVKSLQRMAKNKDGQRIVKERILSPTKAGNGYLTVMLYSKKIPERKIIHRLIALNFIPNPNNKPQVNHINGIRTDNRIDNLEWCTAKENINHAFKIGLMKGQTKLNEIEVMQIRELYSTETQTQSEIAVMFKTTRTNIGRIVRQETWIN